MHRLNHHHLYIFWTFAKSGSFTQAARELRIAQSAVTLQIKQLEEVLGLQLINRDNKRRPELTEQGRRVLIYAQDIFEQSQALMNWAIKGGGSQKILLRAGALSGLSRNLQYEFFLPIVNDPRIMLEVITGDQEKLIRLLRDYSIDVILSSHNVASEGRSSYESHVLTSSPLIFVKKKEAKSKGPQDLKHLLTEYPLYIPGKTFEARAELEAYLNNLKVSYRVAGEIDDIALLRIFSLRSGAIVALPELGVKLDIEEGALTSIAHARGVVQRFYAITREKKLPMNLVDDLIQRMKKIKV